MSNVQQSQSQSQNKVITMPDVMFNKGFRKITNLNERNAFLASKFSNPLLSLSAENIIFSLAYQLCPEYSGGLWDFAEIKSEVGDTSGFFMYPSDDDETFTLQSMNHSANIEVDNKVFGFIVSQFAFSHGSFHKPSQPILKKLPQEMAEHYHKLRGAFYNSVDRLVYDMETGQVLPEVESQPELKQVKEMSSAVTRFLD